MAKTISDLLDITDFVISKGNGVRGLSELGLKSVPNQYIQPLEERISTMIMSQDSIPIIDMSNWNDPKVVESICSAAEKLGFFQLVNHGVPVEVLENVKEATHRFFVLPAEEKSKYSKEHSPSNNVQYGTSFSPQAEKALEWKDFLGLYAYEDEDEASAFWPPVCRDEVLEYMKKSEILTKRLVELLMRGLNVKEIDKAKEYLLMGAKRIQLNYYPICPNPELAVGNGRHSDISTLTILLQDDIGGLYVRRNDNGNDNDSGWM